ncbi:WPP domain-associated protein [Malania oleifera]|uniref:WPP domain-associated protein n=1 Tax=Malania oleifera TaxID=397392 RepID=UPI0025AE024E|nr:WPP domain-associated protein [Malania oleifera]
MDEFFSGSDGNLGGASITESTMMRILHSAMDRAQEKVKSKEGVLERLSERSKFCELAIMQLDGCLKFVQEEMDAFVLESSHERVLDDLTEIRDRLRRRLRETELAISKKDRELSERSENEVRLIKELEQRERELIHLHAVLDLERAKNEGVQELIMGDGARRDEIESRDGEIFCELKHSVDQQFWQIKQKLEDERITLSKMNLSPSNSLNLEPDFVLVEEVMKEGIESKVVEPFEEDQYSEIKTPTCSLVSEINIGIEQMGSDIDILKETFDLAFGRMHNAIYLSELGPVEKQWRWTIEKDTMSILFKGFLGDLPQKFEAEVGKRGKKVFPGILYGHWSNLMNGIISLHRELEPLSTENEVGLSNIKSGDSLASLSRSKISKNIGGETLPECNCSSKPANSSLQIERVEDGEELSEDEPAGDGSHSVLNLIRNHESFIRKKSEELNWLQQVEMLRAKGSSWFQKDKEPDSLKRRISEVVARLDQIIKLSTQLNETIGDSGDAHELENCPGKRLSKTDIYHEERMDSDILADVQENMSIVSDCHSADGELHNEIERLKQENEDLYMQSVILEETNAVLFVGLMKELYIEFYNDDIERKEGTGEDFFKEMVNEGKEDMKSLSYADHDFTSADRKDAWDESNFLEGSSAAINFHCNLESMIREHVCAVLLRGTVEEWKKMVESYNTENLVREEIYQIIINETMNDILSAANSALYQHQVAAVSDSCNFPYTSECFGNVESLVKEDVQMVLVREMMKAWEIEMDAYNNENLIREEIYQFVFAEVVKDASFFLKGYEANNQNNYPEDLIPNGKSPEVGREGSLIQNLDSLLQCLEEEEDLELSTSSETKEHKADLDFLGLEAEGSDDFNIYFKELQNEDESAFFSANSKLEKALQQLALSKKLLGELAAGDEEKSHDESLQQTKDYSNCLPKENTLVQFNPSASAFTPLIEFPLVFEDFGSVMHEKLAINHMRLDEVRRQLDPLTELATSLRKKELAYRKAFLSRCKNLQKAEMEVDLLGDQVEMLLELLGKIYMTLNYYAPVLQNHFAVSDILKSIENELSGVAAHRLKN